MRNLTTLLPNGGKALLKKSKTYTDLRRAVSFLAASILLEILFLLALIRSSCFSWLMSHKVDAAVSLEEVNGTAVVDGILGLLCVR